MNKIAKIYSNIIQVTKNIIRREKCSHEILVSKPKSLAIIDQYSLLSDNLSNGAFYRGRNISAVDRGEVGLLILLDMSSAFDTVDHLMLDKILKNKYAIDGSAHEWFQSYLSDRTIGPFNQRTLGRQE